MLAPNYFKFLQSKFGSFKIDLFASYATRQCARFYSYLPDPYAEGVDAFSYTWESGSYAFPPFNLITRTIQKIQCGNSDVTLVVPNWETQPWFPLFKKLAVSEIVILGPNKSLLFDPFRNCYISLTNKMSPMAAVLSGKYGTV